MTSRELQTRVRIGLRYSVVSTRRCVRELLGGGPGSTYVVEAQGVTQHCLVEDPGLRSPKIGLFFFLGPKLESSLNVGHPLLPR